MGERTFTHGNRIYRYQGHVDQLEEIASALESKRATSRAVVVLLHPGADRISQMENEFPSFCLVQFLVRESPEEGQSRLDCIAYFRKLEVRYWWLVNIAELASLQRSLISRLSVGPLGADPVLPDLGPGSITTVAARAHAGTRPFRVQVPRIDRYYAMARERLYGMVHALVWAQMPDRGRFATEWLSVLNELVPGEQAEPNGRAVAVEGIRYLQSKVIELQNTHESDDGLRDLSTTLGAILAANENYAKDQRLKEVTRHRHTRWRSEVQANVRKAIELTVARILAT